MDVLKDLSIEQKSRIYNRLYQRAWRKANREKEREADRERKARQLERMLHNGELREVDVLKEIDK